MQTRGRVALPLIAFVLAWTPLQAQATDVAADSSLARPVRFRPLPSYVALRDKLESGAPVNVGVIGGSVTFGGVARPVTGYDRKRDGWVYVFMAGLVQRYPNVNWINAAVGSSNSTYAYQRIRDDLAPNGADHWFGVVDLMIWEFVINDSPRAYNAVVQGIPTTDPRADLSLPRSITRLEELGRTYAAQGGAGAAYMMGASRRGYRLDDRPNDPTSTVDQLNPHFNFDRSRSIAKVMSSRLGIPFFDTPERMVHDLAFQGISMFKDDPIPGNVNHPTAEGHRAMGEGALLHFLEVLERGGESFPAEHELAIPPVRPSPARVRSYWVAEPELFDPPVGWRRRPSPLAIEPYRRGGRIVLECLPSSTPESFPLDLSHLDYTGAMELTLVTEVLDPADEPANVELVLDFNGGAEVRRLWTTPTGSQGQFLKHATLLDDLPEPIQSLELRVLGPADAAEPLRFALHGVLLNLRGL